MPRKHKKPQSRPQCFGRWEGQRATGCAQAAMRDLVLHAGYSSTLYLGYELCTSPFMRMGCELPHFSPLFANCQQGLASLDKKPERNRAAAGSTNAALSPYGAVTQETIRRATASSELVAPGIRSLRFSERFYWVLWGYSTAACLEYWAKSVVS